MLTVRRTGLPTLFDELNSFNGLFDTRAAGEQDASPAVDVWDDGANYVVTASLPGVGKDNLDIEVENNVLTITAKREVDKENREYHRREIYRGSYSRSMKFSAAVDAAKVKAAYVDGLLTVTLPKEERIKPRKIEVATN